MYSINLNILLKEFENNEKKNYSINKETRFSIKEYLNLKYTEEEYNEIVYYINLFRFIYKKKEIRYISNIKDVKWHNNVNLTSFFIYWVLSYLSFEDLFEILQTNLTYNKIRNTPIFSLLDKEYEDTNKKLIYNYFNTIKSFLDIIKRDCKISNNNKKCSLKYYFKNYMLNIDMSGIFSDKFLSHWLKLNERLTKTKKNIIIWIIFMLISIIWTSYLFLFYNFNIQIINWYSINFIVVIFIVIFFILLKFLSVSINWYFNLSKMKDLYEYFQLMLEISDIQLKWIKDEKNETEIKKVIMNNISGLLNNIDSVYNKEIKNIKFKHFEN